MTTILNRLKEIASAVLFATEGSDLEAVLGRIAEAAREIAQTKYAALGIPDGKDSLRYFETAGMDAETRSMIPHLPKGHGLIGEIMRGRQTIRLPHMKDDPRSTIFPENHPHMDSFLGVPVIVGHQLYGMLYLSDKLDGTPFNDEDQLLVETLAGYAAVAIANASMREQESRLALLEERERIGMELHDGVIQSIYGVGMQTARLRRQETIKGSDLDPIVDNLNDVIDEIREFIGALRARGQRKQTLVQCLHHLKERLNPPADIVFTIDAPDIYPAFTPATFESICLIVNEAMSNAIRHAKAKQVTVHAEYDKHHLHIHIEDDGKGFNVEETLANGAGGLGLRNMRHRARLYGGDIDITSHSATGTEVKIHIPVGAY